MKKALLFINGEPSVLVSADDVKAGLYDRRDEYVDPEYEFKVQFVIGARNNGGPYFRYYYSYEDYKRLYPDRADRYEIVANMRRYEESKWHREWKESVASFCVLEKCFHNSSGKRRFADAYYAKTNTCIEFQHSYISFDFEERNAFYSDLSINTIWLYDLPRANARDDGHGCIEILEDNARGFFRISENPENLKNHFVYIQVKSGMIYRVCELGRRETTSDKKSTIRFFVPTERYTPEQFIEAIQNGNVPDHKAESEKNDRESSSAEATPDSRMAAPQKLSDLWNSSFIWMIVDNVERGDTIMINCDDRGEMFRDFKTGCIKFKYADDKFGTHTSMRQRAEYSLKHEDERKAIWIRRNEKRKS